MIITWLGHAKVALRGAGITVVIDPFDAAVGYPMDTPAADVVLVSHGHHDHDAVDTVPGTPEVVREPGKYRMGETKIKAIASYHDDVQGQARGTNLIFIVQMEGRKVAHLGDLGHYPDEEQINAIRGADVLFVPVGGNYTIDAAQAARLVDEAQPHVAVAMHYKTDVCQVAIAPLAQLEAHMAVTRVPGNTLDTQSAQFEALSGMLALDYR